MKPLGFFDYNKLQCNALTVLSDSGTVSEEASILKFHALNIRETHERPEAMEEACVMMVGLDVDRVLQALDVITKQKPGIDRLVADYRVPDVANKIVRIILSYSDYVKRTVWKDYQ
jgi:UDP-N-acetylglucosamine 2-epimerase (non-hydrolysing)